MARNNKNRGNNNSSNTKGKEKPQNTSRSNNHGKTFNTNDKESTSNSSNNQSPEKTGPDDNKGEGDKSEDDRQKQIKPRPNNDFEWYNSDPFATESVARVPFSEALGDMINSVQAKSGYKFVQNNANQTESTLSYNVKTDKQTAEPGILVMRTMPYYGSNSKITDPLNLAATEIYTMVRKSNNGRKNYDPSDLMMYVLAISELYGYLFWMERMYGLCYMYSQRNKYIGKELIRAAGGSPDSLIGNLANFRYWINIFINRMAAYAIPNNIALFARRAFMYANVYTESETGNIKDQLYMFAPAAFYKFDLDEKGRGMLDLLHIDRYPKTLTDLITIGDNLFSNINQDEDFALMSGDIFKAYEGNIMTLAEMPEAYALLPVYEHEVLTQMKNATIVGDAEKACFDADYFTYYAPVYGTTASTTDRFRSGRVYQNDKGVLHCNVVFPLDGTQQMDMGTASVLYSNPILSTDIEAPQTSDVMEMTRLIARYEDLSGLVFVGPNVDSAALAKAHAGHTLNAGSDICVSIEVLVNDYSANQHESGSAISRYLYDTPRYAMSDADTVLNVIGQVLEMIKLKSFKFAPMLYSYEVNIPDSATINYTVRDVYADLMNYGLISNDQLKRIHAVALFSLCHVPGISINLSTK